MNPFSPIPLNQWSWYKDRPFVIAGPCSAESREQVLETARALKEQGKVNLFRAGVWKPRTRPDSFEGRGEEALDWLIEAKKETGLPVITEVANASHVEKCLKKGVDAIWIGARTTVNPFYVQEIADAVEGTGIPVFVKNPVSPDLPSWIGALERIWKAGTEHLVTIHRGFSAYGKSSLRNSPNWELVVDLKREFPSLPILCDPSHIAGTHELVPSIAQKALDLDMDGLMVEVHPNPSQALSDAEQQLNPTSMKAMLDNLLIREVNTANQEFRDKLEMLREKIDELDQRLIRDLATRMELVEKIGEYKKTNQVTILQLKRWEAIVQERTNLGKALGLSDEFLTELLRTIHKSSIKRQMSVMNGMPEEEQEDITKGIDDNSNNE